VMLCLTGDLTSDEEPKEILAVASDEKVNLEKEEALQSVLEQYRGEAGTLPSLTTGLKVRRATSSA